MYWRLWGVAILALLPAYWLAWSTPAIGIYHDDSIYVLTARALAEGRGYVIESVPGGMTQTKYPVLFPAILSLVWRLWPEFPGNLGALKAVPLLGAAVWMALSGWLAYRVTGSRAVGWGVVALCAASRQVVFLSTTVLSETWFAALATGALLALWSPGRALPWGRVVLGAGLAAAAFHTRSIGVAVVAAGAAGLLWQRDWKRAALFVGVAGALMTPWWWWQATHREAASAYLSSANYYADYNVLRNFAMGDKLRIVATNLMIVPLAGGAFYGWTGLAVLSLAAFPFLVRGSWRAVWPAGGALATAVGWLGASIALVTIWAWPPVRFLAPLLPVALIVLWSGIPEAWRGWAARLAAVLVLAGAADIYGIGSESRRTGIWVWDQGAARNWAEFAAQMEWLRGHTAAGDVVQANVDPTVYLLAGRRAVRGSERNAGLGFYFQQRETLGTAEEYRDYLRRWRVKYVVLTEWDWFLETREFARLARQSRERYPEDWRRVWRGEAPGFEIWEVGEGTR